MTNAKIDIKWKNHRFQSTGNVSYSKFNYERTNKKDLFGTTKNKKKYEATMILAA